MKTKEQLLSNLRILQAITVLEYENKNYLAGSNKSRNEEMQLLLTDSLILANRLPI